MRYDQEFDEAILLLMEQLWYLRHQKLHSAISGARLEQFIIGEKWEQRLEYAAEIEKRHGHENLGPWSKFEEGMLNGKLSALRWVKGGEW